MRRNRRRPANDERRARFIDQDGIDFIHNGIVITALNLLFARRGHAVVAQIIETELAVRSVSDVHRVLFAANIRLLVVFDARSEEHTSELQSQSNLVCRLLLEKKKKIYIRTSLE